MLDFNVLDAVSNREASRHKDDDPSVAMVLKFETLHNERISNVKDLCGRLPVPGEVMMLWTLNSFNAFTFIVYVIKHVGSIDELSFSTYSLNERILSSLCRWYDKGEIRKVNILISGSIRQRMPKVYDLLCSQSSARNINIRYEWNHSKVILMRVGDDHLLVEGSGNFSENALYEQYVFLNDEKAYSFRLGCLGFDRQG